MVMVTMMVVVVIIVVMVMRSVISISERKYLMCFSIPLLCLKADVLNKARGSQEIT